MEEAEIIKKAKQLIRNIPPPLNGSGYDIPVVSGNFIYLVTFKQKRFAEMDKGRYREWTEWEFVKIA